MKNIQYILMVCSACNVFAVSLSSAVPSPDTAYSQSGENTENFGIDYKYYCYCTLNRSSALAFSGGSIGYTVYEYPFGIGNVMTINGGIHDNSTMFTSSVHLLYFLNNTDTAMYLGLGGGLSRYDIMPVEGKRTMYEGYQCIPLVGVMWGRHSKIGTRLQLNLDMHYYPEYAPHFESPYLFAPYISLSFGAHARAR